jgi:hypothetical protein
MMTELDEIKALKCEARAYEIRLEGKGQKLPKAPSEVIDLDRADPGEELRQWRAYVQALNAATATASPPTPPAAPPANPNTTAAAAATPSPAQGNSKPKNATELALAAKGCQTVTETLAHARHSTGLAK